MGCELTSLLRQKELCCGCGACLQKCPKGCITMQEDKEGFFYPVVCEELCIHCGLCVSVCPFHNQEEVREPIKAFSAIANDEIIRKESSSGGVFSLIAKQVIDAGGVVFGASFDKDWNVHHECIESESDLWKLRGSKYVQSNIGDSYILAHNQLRDGRTVLFSGTPCQIAGLRHFLGKDYPGLLTVDLVCHGVPSPGVWRWYLNKVKRDSLSQVSAISFRNKDYGWRRYSVAIDIIQSGTVVRQHCYHRDDPYMKAFLSDLSLRPSCSSCQVKSGKSHSDITLADFWCIERVVKGGDDDKGVSLVMANTLKGESYLALNHGISFHAVDFRQAIQYNRAWSVSFPKNPSRDSFFASYSKHIIDFDRFVERKLQPKLCWKKQVKNRLKYLLTRIGK